MNVHNSRFHNAQSMNPSVAPTFGHDYRTLQRKNAADKTRPVELQQARLMPPNPPRSPAKLINSPNTQTHKNNPPPHCKEPSDSNLFRQTNGNKSDLINRGGHLGLRATSESYHQTNHVNRGMPRPDSMFLTPSEPFRNHTNTINASSHASTESGCRTEADRSTQLEKSIMNINIQKENQSANSPCAQLYPSEILIPNDSRQQRIESNVEQYHEQQQPSSFPYTMPTGVGMFRSNLFPYVLLPDPNNILGYQTTPGSTFGHVPPDGNQQPYMLPQNPPQPIMHFYNSNSLGSRPLALLPNSYMYHPQMAIVATDPATLRALLSGGLTSQPIMQPIILSQQPFIGQPPTTNVDYTRYSHTQKHESQPFPDNMGKSNESTYNEPPSTVNEREPISINIPEREYDRTMHEAIFNDPPTKLNQTDVLEQHTANSQPKIQRNPDIVICSRHSTSGINTNAIQDLKTTGTRIGHPPRTLKFLPQNESPKSRPHADAHRNITAPVYREPRKLNATKLIEDPERKNKPGSETWGPEDLHTLGCRREPNSISAYYERIKAQPKCQIRKEVNRTKRPVSAYRPIGEIEDTRKQDSTAQLRPHSSAPQQRVIDVEQKESSKNRRGPSPVLLRSNTSHPTANDDPKFDQSVEVSPMDGSSTSKDPTVRSVAERARRWLNDCQKELNDRNRYSTCGFIDQDLIDCQELVPVEDRVKMFDSVESRRNEDYTPVKLKAEPISSPNPNNAIARSATVSTEKYDFNQPQIAKATTSLRLQTNEPTIPLAVSRANIGFQVLRANRPTSILTSVGHPTQPPLISQRTLHTKGISENVQGDKFSRMTVDQKRHLFNRELASRNAKKRSPARSKTQPVTLDDLARANQLILARLDGRYLDSQVSLSHDDESIGFQERGSELSTPEASMLSF